MTTSPVLKKPLALPANETNQESIAYLMYEMKYQAHPRIPLGFFLFLEKKKPNLLIPVLDN